MMNIVLTLLRGIIVLLFESLKMSNVKRAIFGATPLKTAQVWPRLHQSTSILLHTRIMLLLLFAHEKHYTVLITPRLWDIASTYSLALNPQLLHWMT
jgi:hypothetical protein